MLKKTAFCLSSLVIVASFGVVQSAPNEFEFIEPAPWKETEKALPSYPSDEDLLPLDIDSVDSPFSFFIDGKSIAVTDDQVVNYTVVMTSDSGAKNVLREGIRCDTKEYKTYAFGSATAGFQVSRNPIWQQIVRTDTSGYRNELFAYYLCDRIPVPLKPKQIIERIKTPDLIPRSRIQY